jgi:hypothetical protein
MIVNCTNVDQIKDSQQFIANTTSDSVVYDLVDKSKTQLYFDEAKQKTSKVACVKSEDVPPCIFRDFTDAKYGFVLKTWKNGNRMYMYLSGE